MILYHGSNVAVERPEFVPQNRGLDFGFGFYTTLNREQAVTFAQRVTGHRKTGVATLNIYSVDQEAMFKECRLLSFDSPNKAWLDFVVANRRLTYDGEQYDLVYGPVANDDVYQTISLYMGGFFTEEETLNKLKIKELYNQLLLGTNRALSYLHFEGREIV